jgi:predicted nucleic acid-binding protein
MNDILIDTNAFVSLIDSSDKWHNRTNQIINNLDKNSTIILLDIVINETINVLSKRLEEKGKSDLFPLLIEKIENDYPEERIYWTGDLNKIYYHKIINLLKTKKGILNFNDSFIVLYMQENHIKKIISFDKDFDEIDKIERLK